MAFRPTDRRTLLLGAVRVRMTRLLGIDGWNDFNRARLPQRLVDTALQTPSNQFVTMARVLLQMGFPADKLGPVWGLKTVQLALGAGTPSRPVRLALKPRPRRKVVIRTTVERRRLSRPITQAPPRIAVVPVAPIFGR